MYGVFGVVCVYVHVVYMVYFCVYAQVCVWGHTCGGQRIILGTEPNLLLLEIGSLHFWPMHRHLGLSTGLLGLSCFYLSPFFCRNDEITNGSY